MIAFPKNMENLMGRVFLSRWFGACKRDMHPRLPHCELQAPLALPAPTKQWCCSHLEA